VFTRRFRRLRLHWRDITQLSDAEATALIRSDEIDVLVDLSGHWANGRVPLFASRPAPVQISLGTYPCTTGLPAMDFRITDKYVDPPGSERLLSEKLVRLHRCYCCYELPRPLPKPGPLPALRRGYVTFGCFQRPQKLSAELMRLWSAILLRTPGSRLLFHHLFDSRNSRHVSKASREPILAALGRHGVAASRVRFAGYRPGSEHLATIAATDIALDSFPYHGMTTTCDSVAMGVPVVTLAGRSHVSRAGVSILTAVGLEDWIAPDGEAYIETTLRHARDLKGLARLRASLPRRVRASPLTNGRDFAKSLERVYRECCRRT
jgi:predicted O-linked N-acetylglucosamine transferase (SPINDLY family)